MDIRFIHTWGDRITKLHKPVPINHDYLPAMVGDTPVGDANWYEYAPPERLCTDYSDDSDICPMRGSKRGIELLEGSGRVHAYSYFMAEKAGRRFAKLCNATGKRFLSIRTSRDVDLGNSQCNRIVYEAFRRGFRLEMCGIKSEWDSTGNWDQMMEFNCDFVHRSRWEGNNHVGSDIYCFNLTGLNPDQIRAIRRLSQAAIDYEFLRSMSGEKP